MCVLTAPPHRVVQAVVLIGQPAPVGVAEVVVRRFTTGAVVVMVVVLVVLAVAALQHCQTRLALNVVKKVLAFVQAVVPGMDRESSRQVGFS